MWLLKILGIQIVYSVFWESSIHSALRGFDNDLNDVIKKN